MPRGKPFEPLSPGTLEDIMLTITSVKVNGSPYTTVYRALCERCLTPIDIKHAAIMERKRRFRTHCRHCAYMIHGTPTMQKDAKPEFRGKLSYDYGVIPAPLWPVPKNLEKC